MSSPVELVWSNYMLLGSHKGLSSLRRARRKEVRFESISRWNAYSSTSHPNLPPNTDKAPSHSSCHRQIDLCTQSVPTICNFKFGIRFDAKFIVCNASW